MSHLRKPLEDFEVAALEWAAGASGQVLVDAAASALAEGADSPTLRVLAGALRGRADEEASQLAAAVFEELGLSIPERLSTEALRALAPVRAKVCLSGEISPRQLAKEMWQTYVATGYASDLEGFSSFDDAYDLIEDGVIAGRAEDVDADVLAAARTLVETGSVEPQPSAEDSPGAAVHSPNLLRRRAVSLAWLTVAWNLVEAVVALLAGRAAGSLALIGFGLDSTVEVASATVVIWQFSGPDEEREQRALRLIGLSFFALAAYVAVQAVFDFVSGDEPDSSAVGIGLAIASLIVMPVLATAKRRTGRRLGSLTVTADSQQTWLCTYLSVVLLIGLLLNATLGWWWADPLAAVVIAALAVREGIEAWSGDACCD